MFLLGNANVTFVALGLLCGQIYQIVIRNNFCGYYPFLRSTVSLLYIYTGQYRL